MAKCANDDDLTHRQEKFFPGSLEILPPHAHTQTRKQTNACQGNDERLSTLCDASASKMHPTPMSRLQRRCVPATLCLGTHQYESLNALTSDAKGAMISHSSKQIVAIVVPASWRMRARRRTLMTEVRQRRTTVQMPHEEGGDHRLVHNGRHRLTPLRL